MSLMSGKVFTFSWKITNFSSNTLINGEKLTSPVITSEKFENTKWYLIVYPKGRNINCCNFISCFLYRNDLDGYENDVKLSFFKLEIMDPNGRSLISKTATEHTNFLQGRGTGFYEFLEIDRLENCMGQWECDTVEVHCHAFVTHFKQSPTLYKAETEIHLQKYSFDWDIKIPPFEGWTKKINCCFKEKIKFDATLISYLSKVYIKIAKPKDRLPELCKLKISILNVEGNMINLPNSTYLFKSPEFETSFEKQELCEKINWASIYSFKIVFAVLAADGTVTSSSVSCSHENFPVFENDLVVENSSAEESLQERMPPRTLQDDVKDMYMDKTYSDVQLRVESETIPAHKCLLSARSPVFFIMFKQDMVENQTGIVDIPDVDTETMRSFLEFLYTDAITNTDFEHILKLMLVADKYQVSALKEKCSGILKSKVSLENACEVISVADMINQTNLKLFILDYMRGNKKDLISSPAWSEWMKKNTALGVEVLTKLSID